MRGFGFWFVLCLFVVTVLVCTANQRALGHLGDKGSLRRPRTIRLLKAKD